MWRLWTGVFSSLSSVTARSADLPRTSFPLDLLKKLISFCGQSAEIGAELGGWSGVGGYRPLGFRDFDVESLRIERDRVRGLRKLLSFFLIVVLSSLGCGDGCGRDSEGLGSSEKLLAIDLLQVSNRRRARMAVQLATTAVRHHTMGCSGAEFAVVVNKVERWQ
jgi:hypothetical protein